MSQAFFISKYLKFILYFLLSDKLITFAATFPEIRLNSSLNKKFFVIRTFSLSKVLLMTLVCEQIQIYVIFIIFQCSFTWKQMLSETKNVVCYNIDKFCWLWLGIAGSFCSFLVSYSFPQSSLSLFRFCKIISCSFPLSFSHDISFYFSSLYSSAYSSFLYHCFSFLLLLSQLSPSLLLFFSSLSSLFSLTFLFFIKFMVPIYETFKKQT